MRANLSELRFMRSDELARHCVDLARKHTIEELGFIWKSAQIIGALLICNLWFLLQGFWIGIGSWYTYPLIGVLLVSWQSMLWVFWRRRLRRNLRIAIAKETPCCISCGYDLTANATAVCPECGEDCVDRKKFRWRRSRYSKVTNAMIANGLTAFLVVSIGAAWITLAQFETLTTYLLITFFGCCIALPIAVHKAYRDNKN